MLFSTQIAKAIEQPDIEAVLLVGRWMWYFEHQDYGARQDLPKSYLSPEQPERSDISKINADSSRTVWQKSIRSTVDTIQSRIHKVVVFSQFPLMHKGLGECHQSPPWLVSRQSHVERCQVRISFKDMMQRLQFTNKQIEELAGANVMTVKPSEILCDSQQEVCDVLSDKGLYYADDNHLSRLGGSFLIDSVSRQLTEFLNQ